MQSLPQLRPTPGSLDSRRLEERPGQMPNSLYLAGGRAATSLSAVILWPEGPERRLLRNLGELQELREQNVPFWLRITGMGQPHLIREVLGGCHIPVVFAPLVLDTPQSTRVDSIGDVIAVVLHRLRFSRDPLNLVSDQVSMLLTHNCLISIEEAQAANRLPHSPTGCCIKHRSPGPTISMIYSTTWWTTFSMAFSQCSSRWPTASMISRRLPYATRGHVCSPALINSEPICAASANSSGHCAIKFFCFCARTNR